VIVWAILGAASAKECRDGAGEVGRSKMRAAKARA
jgi:hypothetical protein